MVSAYADGFPRMGFFGLPRNYSETDESVATFAAKAVDEADSFLKNGKTGATSEKQLFDCFLVTKANADKMTAPFTLTK